MNFEMEELMPIVAELARKYTSGESSSVSYEKARQLMEAVIFCMEEAERADGMTVVPIKGQSPWELYLSGYELVCEKTRMALKLYHEIMAEFKDYRNRALHDTVVKGMPEFFKYYDAQYKPQDKILTLDYITMRSVEELNGIDAIYQYLFYIKREQEFLHTFTDEYVEMALLDYHENYEELFVNIPSVVLRYGMKEKKGEDIGLLEWTQMEKEFARKLYGGGSIQQNLKTLKMRKNRNEKLNVLNLGNKLIDKL